MRAAIRLSPWASLLAVLVLGCQDDGLAPWVPGLRRNLTAEDYAVYSAWLTANRPRGGGVVLVDDRTTGNGYQGLSVVSAGWLEPNVPVVGDGLIPACLPGYPCVSPPPPVAVPPSGDEATQDFWLQREVSAPLEPRLEGAVYDLVRDPVPEDLLSVARLVVSFSRVGFDSEARVAAFEVVQARRGDWGWFRPVHYAVRAEKPARWWVLVDVVELPPPPPGITLPPVIGDSSHVAIGTPLTITVPGCRTSRLPHVGFCTSAVTKPGP